MIKPGVLILKGNRIFGRKGKKLLYQAVSVDGEKYIIPYQPKPNFETFGENMYILLDTEKHVCVDNFGKVSNLDSYQKYRLHCLKLVYSLKKFPKNLLWNSSSNIEFENEFIFTIDPIGCKDFDDAISINNEYITIYISNVPVILEQLQLWDYMTEQTSTIYFPTSNIPMLPKQISENICSLVANHEKKMVFYLSIPRKDSLEQKFGLDSVSISKNFDYDSTELQKSNEYKSLFEFAKQSDMNIEDSHDMVAFYMILFNKTFAEKMETGIFRSTISTTLPTLFQYQGEYGLEKNKFHHGLGLSTYSTFTSPIRRLVDCINLTLFMQQNNLYIFSPNTMQKLSAVYLSDKFMEHLNTQTKNIKKIQNEMILLHSDCEHVSAQIIEKKSDEKYNVFVKKFSIFMPIYTQTPLILGQKYNCKIYRFETENNLHQKIQLQLK